MEHQKNYFWSPWVSDVTIAMSLLRSAQDFLDSTSGMFIRREILKRVLKSKI